MEKNEVYYVEYLKTELQQRMRKNSSYSLRSFARHLDISPQVLSEVIRYKRKLPQKYLDQVVDRLELNPVARQKFSTSMQIRKKSLKDVAKVKLEEEKILSEERHYKIIAEWEYYAVLNLLDLKGSKKTPKQIAQRLNLSLKRVEYVLEALEKESFVTKTKTGTYKRLQGRLNTTNDIPSSALRKAHKDILKLASEKIEVIPVEQRFYSSSTLCFDKSKLAEAKDLIIEFRNKFCDLMQKKTGDEVYQFNIQMFPLTNIEDKK
jgi:uncharacterized protein (TIGR02147 family)